MLPHASPIFIRFGEYLNGSSKVEYSSVRPSKLALSFFFRDLDLDFLAALFDRKLDSNNNCKNNTFIFANIFHRHNLTFTTLTEP